MNKNHNYRHLHIVRHDGPKYPNAADPQYYAQKAIDVLTAVISAIGFISAMVFMVTMS